MAVKKKYTRKYGTQGSEAIAREMHEFKRGTLKSGRSGKTVKDPKQAIAIALSEARREGAQATKKTASKKKSAARTNPASKTAAQKSATKKPATKKPGAKTSAKKSSSR